MGSEAQRLPARAFDPLLASLQITEFLTTGKVAALDAAGKTAPKAAGAPDAGALKFA
jgi:hypothetical protein